MIISILMFIFSKFFSFIFLGQIWSQNLKFFKFTEIWQRGRLPYAYFNFNVYFFKILFIYIFGTNLVPKSEVLQIGWNLVQVDYHMLISILMFVFFKILFIHIFGANLVPKSEVLQIDWNFVPVFLTHVGIRQMPTRLPTWKAKLLYHVGTFLPTWFILPLKSCKDIFKYICFTLYPKQTVNNWESTIAFIDRHCFWCFFSVDIRSNQFRVDLII